MTIIYYTPFQISKDEILDTHMVTFVDESSLTINLYIKYKQTLIMFKQNQPQLKQYTEKICRKKFHDPVDIHGKHE